MLAVLISMRPSPRSPGSFKALASAADEADEANCPEAADLVDGDQFAEAGQGMRTLLPRSLHCQVDAREVHNAHPWGQGSRRALGRLVSAASPCVAMVGQVDHACRSLSTSASKATKTGNVTK
jgi:endonuclease YncB( thermonuclease family)